MNKGGSQEIEEWEVGEQGMGSGRFWLHRLFPHLMQYLVPK